MTFTDWLLGELTTRGWNKAELARHCGDTDRGTISRIMSGDRNAGPDVCTGIARALNLPPEQVFRRAGLLPGRPEDDEDLMNLVELVRGLAPDDRTVVRAMVVGLVEMRRREANK